MRAHPAIGHAPLRLLFSIADRVSGNLPFQRLSLVVGPPLFDEGFEL